MTSVYVCISVHHSLALHSKELLTKEEQGLTCSVLKPASKLYDL